MEKTWIRTSRTLALAACLAAGAFAASGANAVPSAPSVPKTGASEYSGQIEKCLKTKEEQRGGISEFICPSGKAAGNNFDVAYQVILDLAFKKIDKEVEAQIRLLKDAGASPITDIGTRIGGWFDRGGTFTSRYMRMCDGGVVREAIAHFGSVSTEGSLEKYLPNATAPSACELLVRQKTEAYRDVAWIVAGKSVVDAYKDGKHKMMTSTKKSYERLQNKIMIMIGQLSTIRDKMPSKTSTVL